MAESGDKLPGLHALRMIAALAVFFLHTVFFAANFVSSVVDFAANYFALSVQLFYLVSAFALMHSTRVYERQHDWVKRFYLKRFWRIAPLYYVMAVVTAVYTWRVYGSLPSPAEVALNATFLNNFDARYATSMVGAGWSVSVEVLFYLMFPLMFVYIRTLKSATLLVAASIAVAQVARSYLEKVPVPPLGSMADYSIATNFPYFAMGVFAFLAYRRLVSTSWGDPDTALRNACICHATFATLIIGLVIVVNGFNPWLRSQERADHILWGVIFMLLALWVTVRPIALFSWPPIQFLGERSYSIYLLHALIIMLLKPAIETVIRTCQPYLGGWAMVPAVVVPLLPLILFATISYAMIEKPGMDLGRRLRTRISAVRLS